MEIVAGHDIRRDFDETGKGWVVPASDGRALGIRLDRGDEGFGRCAVRRAKHAPGQATGGESH